MHFEIRKIFKVEELNHLVPTKAGATYSQLWQIFYYARLCKYVTYEHLIKIKPAFNKICTYKGLQTLCKLGYLKSPQQGVYCATDKVLPILKETGYMVDTLPAEPIGKGDINELNNTDVFIQVLKIKHFYTLLYPQFKMRLDAKPYLKPDALLILKDTEQNRYKLIFLEIEAHKPDWENYIIKKRNNYLRLAKDGGFYTYWQSMCTKLKLPMPDISQLSFSVCFVGETSHDFGEGFIFKESLI